MTNAVVIGTGFIGPVHVEALRRAGVNVAGILGSSPTKSRQAAESLGLSKGYSSFAEVLEDPHVSVVHITTPNRYHHEQTKAALLAGKHVMCEKPLAMSPVQSSELVALAKDRGLAAGVAYNIRFYPLCHEAAERIRTGLLGKVFHVVGSYTQDWLLYPTDYNWRVSAEDGGQLRAVADIGTHWLDLIQFIVGQKIVSVCADLSTIHEFRYRNRGSAQTFSQAKPSLETHEPVAIQTEDCGSILFRLSSGAQGTLWVSQTTAGKKNSLQFEIAGSEQALAWESQRPNELWIGHRTKPNETLIRDPSLLSQNASRISNYPGGHNEGFPDSFKQLFRVFYNAIATGSHLTEPRFPTFEDGHYEILLCDAIFRSNLERRWIDV